MARQIRARWKISGTLTAETPIHIGGIGGNADTDLALAVNGQGEYYIPGTSLAGAFRGWLTTWLQTEDHGKHEESIKDLWGAHDSEDRGASFIIIDDAEVDLADMAIEIREGVGINRETGAAADQGKYNRAILPKGVSLPLNIILEIGDPQKQRPDHLWNLLCALEAGDIRLGAAKTRGLGKVKLKIISIHEQKWDAQNIFEVLLQEGRAHSWDELKPQYRPAKSLTLNIDWKPRDPVMVKTEGGGMAVDILPLVSQVNSALRFVIPGSSIKGVLRAHAERIVRTVLNSTTPDEFLRQVDLTLVNEIFGGAEKNSSPSAKSTSQGWMGVLSVDDCYACFAMDLNHWSQVESAPKGEGDDFTPVKQTLTTALGGTEQPFKVLQPAMHVAVDRWTGGSADAMLYSVLEPIGVEWETIGIHLDLNRLEMHKTDYLYPTIALLFLVLRDFANRKIPIGYGTNRGMGTVEVTEIGMQCSRIDGLETLETLRTLAPDLSNLNEGLLNVLTKAWIEWIDNNQQQEAV
jgi:CRISPR/Cas system CSM-associated protein Csm3 (group 7 of RAMP superfamily)